MNLEKGTGQKDNRSKSGCLNSKLGDWNWIALDSQIKRLAVAMAANKILVERLMNS